MNRLMQYFKTLYHSIWIEAPWIRAAGILSAASVGLIYLNLTLPDSIRLDLKNESNSQFVIIFIVIMYFFLVAIFAGDRLRFQKKLRELEQNFRYDNRGTLFNGDQPNIAFRIQTFKGIF